MTTRAQRRHHRARRLAAVAHWFKSNDSDCDGVPQLRRLLGVRVNTRTPCSCHHCKHSRYDRSVKRERELAVDLRERRAIVEAGIVEGLDPYYDGWWLDERAEEYRTGERRLPPYEEEVRWVPETESMLAKYEQLREQDIDSLTRTGLLTRDEAEDLHGIIVSHAKLGIDRPFGESGYSDDYEW